MQKNKKKDFTLLGTILIVLASVTGLVVFLSGRALAEQVGDSPTAGATSRIKELSDELIDLGYGSTDSGSWGDWGDMWNRIYSASIESGGTGLDWEKQSLQQRDNRDSTDYGETSTWTKTNNDPEVWYDEVTGLYWSPVQSSSMSNDFDRSECPFYSTEPRGDYNGGDIPNCGNAIEECATLSLAIHTDGDEREDWYLPSQLELLQAYINGIYKRTSTSWVGTSSTSSSTESQNNTQHIWYSRLSNGTTSITTKTNTLAVRCVLRD